MGSVSDIVVVSGLPRSGTSLMMQMLGAAGLPLLIDQVRRADPDNPEGYYEHEGVKELPTGSHAWLDRAGGKAVKVISALLEYLPSEYNYRVIFMQRSLPEILASQKKMLVRRDEPPDTISDEKLTFLYQRHLAQVERWLATQSNMQVLMVDYNRLVQDPEPATMELSRFLGGQLDVDAMVRVVKPALYRNRASV